MIEEFKPQDGKGFRPSKYTKAAIGLEVVMVERYSADIAKAWRENHRTLAEAIETSMGERV